MKMNAVRIIVFIFALLSIMLITAHSQDKGKDVLTKVEFVQKLQEMSSADQIFDYLGQPNSYKSYNITPYSLRFIIEYDWENINDVPVKIDVEDKTGDHFYARQLKFEVIDELKEREEIRKLGKPVRAKKKGQDLAFKITKMEVIPSPQWPTEFTMEKRRKIAEKMKIITIASVVINNLDSSKNTTVAMEEYVKSIELSKIEGSGIVYDVAKEYNHYNVLIMVAGTSAKTNPNCTLRTEEYNSKLKKGDKIKFDGRLEKYQKGGGGGAIWLNYATIKK